jgi:hypothetical protein
MHCAGGGSHRATRDAAMHGRVAGRRPDGAADAERDRDGRSGTWAAQRAAPGRSINVNAGPAGAPQLDTPSHVGLRVKWRGKLSDEEKAHGKGLSKKCHPISHQSSCERVTAADDGGRTIRIVHSARASGSSCGSPKPIDTATPRGRIQIRLRRVVWCNCRRRQYVLPSHCRVSTPSPR